MRTIGTNLLKQNGQWFLFRSDRPGERIPLAYPVTWSAHEVCAEIDLARKAHKSPPFYWGPPAIVEREPHNVPKPRSEWEGLDIAHIESAEAEPSAETDLFEYHLSAILAQS